MEVRIPKATLPKLAACKGKFDPQTEKVFAGFAGTLDIESNLYVGKLRFVPAPEDHELDTCNISAICAGGDNGDP